MAPAKKPSVWFSKVFVDSTLLKGFGSDVHEHDRVRAVDAMRRNVLGEDLPSERFAKEFWYEYPDKKIRKVPDFAMIGGYWVVSNEMKQVLEQFDLGKTTFYPTKLYEHDRKTEVAGTHYCINFAEVKDSFLPEHSPEVKKPYDSVDYYNLEAWMEEGLVAVSGDTFGGVDLWLEKNLRQALFFSDRLVSALKKAKLTRRLSLRKCTVVDG
ncbi:DUF1629 domain-containing protein [uncultured Aliiroseovarius sp.]|uniref:imm11 family protein n=1 Tax=uncultured Aliiroseovarius sp. TaxID=1658783 RepID=UPI002627D6A2|nr:DUF1629 domain-containing protein [uncultured Aliiroseovarius sp.]